MSEKYNNSATHEPESAPESLPSDKMIAEIGKETLNLAAGQESERLPARNLAAGQESERLPAWKQYVDSLTDEQIANDEYDEAKLTRTAEDFYVDYDDYTILRQQALEKLVKAHELDKGVNKKVTVNINEAVSIHTTATQRLIDIISGRNEQFEKPDQVIYLDKSGHPLAWLVNTFWDDMAKKDETGAAVKRPPHSFVNIDRVRVLADFFGVRFDGKHRPIDYEDTNEAWRKNHDQLTIEHFAPLRALFLEKGLDPAKNPTMEDIMAMPSTLDNKKLLIIDETTYKGTTLAVAKDLFSRAFPTAQIETTDYWLQNGSKSTPVWYPNDMGDARGRGIGDIDEDYYATQYETHPNPITYARHVGSKFYSAPLNLEEEVGQPSRRLMKDIQTMHRDYQDGKILVNPSLYSETYLDDFDREMELVVRQGVNPRNFAKIAEEIYSRPLNYAQ